MKWDSISGLGWAGLGWAGLGWAGLYLLYSFLQNNPEMKIKAGISRNRRSIRTESKKLEYLA